jgi:hypothetical protein
MSFDLIETTVANAVLLQASYDDDPVHLHAYLSANPVDSSYKDNISVTGNY